MALNKENLLQYIRKAPQEELRTLAHFLADALNEQNLADLSPYFKVRMSFDPPVRQKKELSETFKEALAEPSKKTVGDLRQAVKENLNISKEDIDMLKAEKLLQEING
jgi:hypothetical protein